MKGIFVGLIVDIILVGLPYLAQSLGLDFPNYLFQMEVPLWITVLAIIIVIPTVVMVSRRRKHGIFVSTGRRPPKSYVVNIEHNYAGVKWKVLYGRARLYREAGPYAFCFSNPYCPECVFSNGSFGLHFP